jgi:hypothetical protein
MVSGVRGSTAARRKLRETSTESASSAFAPSLEGASHAASDNKGRTGTAQSAQVTIE